MGVSTPAVFAGKMGALSVAVEKLPKSALTKAGLAGKAIIASGAPDRLRNVGKNGSKLGVRLTVSSDGIAIASAKLKATGAWPIIESDTPPHAIPRLAGSKSRAKNRVYGPAFGGENVKKLLTPYGVRATVWHPGTKGKHPWAKGAEKVVVLTPKLFAAELSADLVALF